MQMLPSLPPEIWTYLIVSLASVSVGALLGALLGGLSSYYVHSKLDERNYRRRMHELLNQELLGPLNAEIAYITEKVKEGALPHSEENKSTTAELERLIRKYQFSSVLQDIQSKVSSVLALMKDYETFLDVARVSLRETVRKNSLDTLGKEITNLDLETTDLHFIVRVKGQTVGSVKLTTAVLSNRTIDDLLGYTTALAEATRDALLDNGNAIGYERGLKVYNKVVEAVKGDINLHNFNITRDAFLKILKETTDMIMKEMRIT